MDIFLELHLLGFLLQSLKLDPPCREQNSFHLRGYTDSNARFCWKNKQPHRKSTAQ